MDGWMDFDAPQMERNHCKSPHIILLTFSSLVFKFHQKSKKKAFSVSAFFEKLQLQSYSSAVTKDKNDDSRAFKDACC